MGFRRNILVKPMVRLMKNSCLENLTEQNRENAGCMCGWNNQKSYLAYFGIKNPHRH